LSRDGLFCPSAAMLNTGSTPTTALLVTALVAIMLAGVGSFDRLFGFTAFLSVLVDVAAFGTVFILRWREPDLSRPFRARGYPVLPAIVFLGAGLLLIAFIVSSSQNSLYAMIGIAVCYPGYFLFNRLANVLS